MTLPSPPLLPPPDPGTPLPQHSPAPAADEGVPGEGERISVRDPDPRWKQDFHGLLYLGALRGEFRYLGHKISIRTLQTSEELILALLTREHAETMGYARAHATGIAALAVEAVDGKPMPVPLGETDDKEIAWARDRYRYAQRWYPFTIDAIFDRYLELEQRAREVLQQLGKSPAPDGATPTSSPTSGSQDDGESSPAGG